MGAGVLALAGCGGAPAAGDGCLLPAQRRQQVTELYFGRDVPGRAPVSEAEWAGFVARQLAPRFPGGFTVIDAAGQWMSPTTHRVAREATKLVRIATPPAPDLANRVQAVVDAYVGLFHQESVGVVSGEACAAF